MAENSWEALPQRKKVRRAGDVDKNSSNSLNNHIDQSYSNSSRTIPRHLDVINQAITARSNFNRATATLQSSDGCAGENFEYLDHTADVQCHCWGNTLREAFEFMAPCMFNYMTEISKIDIDDERTTEIQVSGHDLQSLLFSYMDTLLDQFCSESFLIKKVEITSFDEENFSLVARCFGETYDTGKHPQGTEIKAITYSNMQIHITPERSDLYVIVDI